MDIKITSVHSKGDFDKEYVTLKVEKDCDVGRYMLFDTTYINSETSTISNKCRHTYWFPDKEVKEGDYIWLHTGPGESDTWENKEGTTTHHFYWDLKDAVWNDEGDCALLVKVADWKGFLVSKQK